MTNVESSSRLASDFKRRLFWIVVASFIAASLVVLVLVLTGPITLNLVVAAAVGTLVSLALGGGLMAAVFYSDTSGYDEGATILSSASQSAESAPDDTSAHTPTSV